MANEPTYSADIVWTGKTEDPKSYDRSFVISGDGKATQINGSSQPLSRGDPQKWNPEELLLSSLASCHMLWYLYYCAVSKIVVTKYLDRPTGKLGILSKEKNGFAEAELNPQVYITDPSRIQEAINLHQKAHEHCNIANSINFKVKITPQVQAAD